MVCNFKVYFVNKVINMGLVKTFFVAWIDFGYCYKLNVIRGLKIWDFLFDESKMYFFIIKKGFIVIF